jgi:hypothetical protein
MEDNLGAMPETAKAYTPPPSSGDVSDNQGRGKTILWGIVALIILAIIIAGTWALISAGPETTAEIRDVFIIFMALVSVVIGVALVILVIQLAVLTNMLKNEIKPILDSTNETVHSLKGTVGFIGDNLAEPVIRFNQYVAGAKRLIDLVRPNRW